MLQGDVGHPEQHPDRAVRPDGLALVGVVAIALLVLGLLTCTPSPTTSASARKVGRTSATRLWVGLPHSFPGTAESDAGRASNLTPISVVAQEARGVGQPPLDGSAELCHWVRERTACAASGTAGARASGQARLARIVRSVCRRNDPVHRRGVAGATIAARLRGANDYCEPARAFAASSSLSTRQTSQPRSSAVIARCTAPGYRCGRRQRGAADVSTGSSWSRRTPISLPWS